MKQIYEQINWVGFPGRVARNHHSEGVIIHAV